MIVVTTPTGQIGAQVLERLVGAGAKARVIARDRARLASGLAGRVEIVPGTHSDPLVLARALPGAHAVFWCVPPDYQLQDHLEYYMNFCRPLANALPGSSVERVVIVAGGRGEATGSGPIGAAHAAMKLIEESGVHTRALHCGFFMENLLQQAGTLRRDGAFFYALDGDLMFPVCATRDIAAMATRLLLDSTWTGQAGIGVHGPAHLSLNQMAEILTRVLGRPIRYHKLPAQEFRASLLQAGASQAFADGLLEMFQAMAAGLHEAVPRTQESTTPTTFERWCDEVLRPVLA